jgi:hypothetical protein
MELIAAVLVAGPLDYVISTRHYACGAYLVVWAAIFPIQTIDVHRPAARPCTRRRQSKEIHDPPCQQRQRQVKGVRMHNTIRRLYRQPRIVGTSLTTATPGPSESAGVLGGWRSARVVRGSQMALGACLVAVLLATTSLTAGTAWGATGGLPGTGDKSFNPAADSEGNHCVAPNGVDANKLLGSQST